MKPVEELTDEELRIEIAEFCGWTIHQEANHKPEGWIDPQGNWKAIITSDYPNDLNAMWEAEEKLDRNSGQLDKYKHLLSLEAFEGRTWTWHATAKQRATAFVKTIREIKTV